MTRDGQPKWEYRTEQYTNHGGGAAYFLTYIGEEGWELMSVSIVQREVPSAVTRYPPTRWNEETYVFKRQKVEPARAKDGGAEWPG